MLVNSNNNPNLYNRTNPASFGAKKVKKRTLKQLEKNLNKKLEWQNVMKDTVSSRTIADGPIKTAHMKIAQGQVNNTANELNIVRTQLKERSLTYKVGKLINKILPKKNTHIDIKGEK